jgi:beta-glucanase (GH16 family)
MKTIVFTVSAFLIAVCTQAENKNDSVNLPKGYSKLVFQDEFNSDGLPDSTRWGFEEGYVRNGEKQYYTVKRIENAFQKDGCLHLTARNDSALIEGKIQPITSASIHTKNTFNWKYGWIDVRAKLPVVLGTWPAIWLMPKENTYGRWPKSGEIDIMEHVGYDPEKVNYAIHTEAFNHTKKNGKGSNAFCPTCYTDFHVYGLEWTSDHLVWYLDGRKRFVLEKPHDANWESWPFDHPFYLILNLAFGGGWGGSKGIDPEGLPQEFIIDYVRIFQ